MNPVPRKSSRFPKCEVDVDALAEIISPGFDEINR